MASVRNASESHKTKTNNDNNAAKANPLAPRTLPNKNSDDDDWETDPDFVNAASERDKRFGRTATNPEAAIVDDSVGSVQQVREKAVQAHEAAKERERGTGYFSHGYGGKYGIQGQQNSE